MEIISVPVALIFIVGTFRSIHQASHHLGEKLLHSFLCIEMDLNRIGQSIVGLSDEGAPAQVFLSDKKGGGCHERTNGDDPCQLKQTLQMDIRMVISY